MSNSVCDGSIQQPSMIALMLTDSISNTSVSLMCEDDDKAYTGPSPSELLEPLFKRPSCSYRVRQGSILRDLASHLLLWCRGVQISNLPLSRLSPTGHMKSVMESMYDSTTKRRRLVRSVFSVIKRKYVKKITISFPTEGQYSRVLPGEYGSEKPADRNR